MQSVWWLADLLAIEAPYSKYCTGMVSLFAVLVEQQVEEAKPQAKLQAKPHLKPQAKPQEFVMIPQTLICSIVIPHLKMA